MDQKQNLSPLESFYQEIMVKPENIPKIYSKKSLSNEINDKVYDYQKKHILKLIGSLLKYSIALDNSDTGTGKTYSSVAACVELNRRPIIVCPKTLLFTWLDVCERFGVKPYDIVNYETVRNGKTYRDTSFTDRIESPFVSVIENDYESGNRITYEWAVPKDAILIFDEAHRCKSPGTDNGRVLLSTRQLIKQGIPVLLASASICEKYPDMKIIFYLLGMISDIKKFNRHIKMLMYKYPSFKIFRDDYANVEEYTVAKDNAISMMINEELRNYTVRIRIRDLGDKFPSNQWYAQQFYAESSDKISKAYEEILVHMQALKEKKQDHHLAEIQKLKQEIELRKIPIFIEQAQLHLDDGKSVIIFVNFIKTMDILKDKLGIKCFINGKQTAQERIDHIDNFQSNKERIIICQIRSGGTGISLHDIHGNHPRVTLTNYPDAASDLLQALGRAHRAGGKTPVLQRIIFVANVEYEKTIMNNINRKLANISAINDGDLHGYVYDIKDNDQNKIN